MRKPFNSLRQREAFDQTTLIDFELRPEIERLRRACIEYDLTDVCLAIKGEGTESPVSAEHIRNLKDQIRDLQQKSDAERPLLEVGIAFRLRFLQQNRDAAIGKIQGDGNQLILREGNAAAHSGNGAANVALFRLEILKENRDLAKLFEGLYDRTPSEYLGGPNC